MHPAEVVAPGEQSDFVISFEPTGNTGTKSATASIDSNVLYLTNPFTFTVTGSCVFRG